MTITNQFVTAGDFWSGMVEPDYEEHLRDLASLRAALHVAISLFHMSDWVFHTHEDKVRAAFPISPANRHPESDFADALELRNQDFGRLRGICHAGKHLKLTNIRPVPSAPSHSSNVRVQATGYGAGSYGSGPYGGTPRVMLEGTGGIDIEFADIAKNVHAMWVDLNNTHHWCDPAPAGRPTGSSSRTRTRQRSGARRRRPRSNAAINSPFNCWR